MKKILKSAFALLMSAFLLLSSLVSCDKVDKGLPPISLPGLWQIQYACDTTMVEPTEYLVDSKDTYMYYQFNEDKSYIMCYVKYVLDEEHIVVVENGTWEHKRGSLDIKLTPNDATKPICKIKLDYPEAFHGIISFESSSETKEYYFRGYDMGNIWYSWRNDVVDEAKPYVRIPKGILCDSRLFTKLMDVNNSYWVLSEDGELDCYVFACVKWNDPNNKKENGKDIVQHCHGRIVINEYQFACDSIDIIIDDYDVPTEDISTSTIMRSYLLPGSHRYPIYYEEKQASIERAKDNLPNLHIWYRTDPFNPKDCHIVPWDFNFAEYTKSQNTEN
ncbi:MAG: hypothetical protein Q4C30_10350 [Bacteroidia bacterium]|nr:hypothetical protein [Bacteroidia bacterium]